MISLSFHDGLVVCPNGAIDHVHGGRKAGMAAGCVLADNYRQQLCISKVNLPFYAAACLNVGYVFYNP
jgi:hypothetical protein